MKAVRFVSVGMAINCDFMIHLFGQSSPLCKEKSREIDFTEVAML